MRGPLTSFCYSSALLHIIAEAAGYDPHDQVLLNQLEEGLNRAALWFELSANANNLIASRDLISRLERLCNTADRAVRHGEMLLSAGAIKRTPVRSRSTAAFRQAVASLAKLLPYDAEYAEDDYPDRKLAIALTMQGEVDDRAIVKLVAAIHDPAIEIEVTIRTVKELSERATAGSERLRRVRGYTLAPGHSGDVAMNGWIDMVLKLYRDITGRKLATSVGKPGANIEGEADGPLIRFMTTAFEPVRDHLTNEHEQALACGRPSPVDPALLSLGPNAWRSRIRTALKGAVKK